jgi:hypothetical protein
MNDLLYRIVSLTAPSLARRGHKNKTLQRRGRGSASQPGKNLPATHTAMRQMPNQTHDQHSRWRRKCGMIASGRV